MPPFALATLACHDHSSYLARAHVLTQYPDSEEDNELVADAEQSMFDPFDVGPA